ncbi:MULTISPECIES: DNA polymerase IV [Paraburkholderia]|uniref:DNA polymerase IV n=1 Tax=Paraburkholderia acidicola TaxID=1912599 RepID=A0ABV1LYB5_9BURK
MNDGRRIAHLDMDAFYASVELLRYPELRGQPVVIGGGRNATPQQLPDGTQRFARLRDYVGRGVVTTSTYEARALGVFSAMGMMKAAALAPDAVLLPTDFDSYRHYSRLFKTAVRIFTDRIEDRGIDEIYIDLTDVSGDAAVIAENIKRAVNDATGLTCSICVAPNKLLAKIGSELDKPDGLTLLSHDDIETRIWPLGVRKINGIGPKATEKLVALGISTVGQLAAADLGVLQDTFGRTSAEWLARVSHGLDERAVVTSSEPVSISRETTFERDLHPVRDRPTLSKIFTDLCMRLAEDLERKGYHAQTIGIKLKFEDFQTVTRDATLPLPIAGGPDIRTAATTCLKRISLDKRLRLIGVRASTLVAREAANEGREIGQAELPFGEFQDD